MAISLRTRHAGAVVGALSIALLAACSADANGGGNGNGSTGGGATQAPAGDSAELRDVSLYVTTSYADWSYRVAAAEGFFEEEGLNVQVNGFNSGADASVAFAADGGDFVQAGDLPSLVFSSKTDVRLLANTAHMDGGVLFVGGSGLASMSDLSGKTIGAALESSPGFWIDQMLVEQGLDDVEVLNLANPDQAAALGGGSVDGVVSFPSTLGKFLEQDGYQLVEQWPTANFLMIDATLLEEEPEVAEAMLRALDKAGEFIMANPDRAAEIQAAAHGITADVVKGWLDDVWGVGYKPTFRELDMTLLRDMYAWAQEKGLLGSDAGVCAVIDLTAVQAVSTSDDLVEECAA